MRTAKSRDGTPINIPEQTIQLLYPEVRKVAPVTILQWAKDSWWNEASRHKCPACDVVTVAIRRGESCAEVRPGEFRADDPNHPCFAHDHVTPEPHHEDGAAPPKTLEEAIAYLSDLGEITVVAF